MTLAKIGVFLLKSVGCFQNPLSVSGQCFINQKETLIILEQELTDFQLHHPHIVTHEVKSLLTRYNCMSFDGLVSVRFDNKRVTSWTRLVPCYDALLHVAVLHCSK